MENFCPFAAARENRVPLVGYPKIDLNPGVLLFKSTKPGFKSTLKSKSGALRENLAECFSHPEFATKLCGVSNGGRRMHPMDSP